MLTLVITRLALASRASRSRIKVLEKQESNTERLVHILGRIEREMEDAVVDMFDSPSLESVSSSGSEPAFVPLGDTISRLDPQDGPRAAAAKAAQKVTLSETQQRIIGWPNTLPGLKKELAFIHPVRNSHAVIISRDVKRFPGHRQGEGVIRHWADHFVV